MPDQMLRSEIAASLLDLVELDHDPGRPFARADRGLYQHDIDVRAAELEARGAALPVALLKRRSSR